MNALFWFWIVLTICHVVEETMAQQCPSERSVSGWMLQRHVYKTMLADIGLHCLLRESLSKTGPLRFGSENQFPFNFAHEYILVQK